MPMLYYNTIICNKFLGCSGVIKSSNSGFGSGGIVGIVVAVAAIGVIAAVAILVLLKRRQHNPRILLSMHSSGGFSRFEDF